MKTLSASHAFAGAFLVIIATAPMLSAQEFTLDSSAVTAGGGQSSGGDFSIDATVAQAEAGGMIGGDFALDAGFWSIITAVDTPGAPTLSLGLVGAEVVVSWPASSGSGFTLEEANAIAVSPATTSWVMVNATSQQTNGVVSVRLPLANGNRFYRLHKL